MAELVPVGRVGRPHGLDGSFVVEDASDDPDRFAVGARLLAGEEAAAVVASKRAGGRVVVRLDRPVERGTVLAVPRDASSVRLMMAYPCNGPLSSDASTKYVGSRIAMWDVSMTRL